MTRLGPLRFLYVGSERFDDDVRWYREVLDAERVWQFAAFGARVAAFRLDAAGPLVLIADHRPARTCMPIYQVRDLEDTTRALEARGLHTEPPVEIPNGPCRVFKDPTGNSIAIFQDMRPNAMESAYQDPKNTSAVR